MPHTLRRWAVVTVAGLVALSGCGTPTAEEAKSAATVGAQAAQACEKVNKELDAIKTDLDNLRSTATKDPKGALTTLNSIISRVTSLGQQAGDPEVERLLTDLGVSLAALRDQLQAAANDPLTQGPGVIGKVRDASNKLGAVRTYCQNAS